MNDSFDLRGAALPYQFNLGCLSIENGHKWRLSHFVWEGTAQSVGATFFCDLKAPWDDRNLVRIETYRLPRGAGQLAERIGWYTRGRKSRRIKIADGQLFDETMLNINCFGDEWDRDAFALSKGEVIRIYQTKKFAVIFRLLARSGTLLDHPIFKRLGKDISFDPLGWEKMAPNITVKQKSKVTDAELSSAELHELRRMIGTLEKRFGITKSTENARRLELVENQIEKVRNQRKRADELRTDIAIEIGAELGQCFCKSLGWEWRRLTFPGRESMVCICCPERRLVLCPSAWVAGLLIAKKSPLNCLLTFNMIKGGRLPPTRPGAYMLIN